MTSRTDKMSACNSRDAYSRAAYMREYRKRKLLEEDSCNNVPKRTKLHAERQREYRETHKNLFYEYMCNYRSANLREKLRKIKHKHLRQLTLHQIQLYTIIIMSMNTFKRIL
jgi:hypothetical protein